MADPPGVHRTWFPQALVLLSIAGFAPILRNGFVNRDDGLNFLENIDYRGLGWLNIRWAWTTSLLGVYQPLAWMLIEAQYVVWGLKPAGYHLTSLLLHAGNAVVLYWLCIALLDRCAPGASVSDRLRLHTSSALAAMLFAIHPLRVEVVAWASCQPYLPCALFSMLAVLAYLRAAGDDRPWRWLLVAFALYAAAMLSKAAAVCLPASLLILDFYPLRRIPGDPRRWFGRGTRRAWLEKIPFALLALAFMVLAIRARHVPRSVVPLGPGELMSRIAQATYGVCFYLAKSVLPLGISALYPFPERIGLSEPIFTASACLVACASVGFFWARRSRPGLLAAWASYISMLSPTLGLIQASDEIAADRYSYIASIAPVVLVAYGLYRTARPEGRSRRDILVFTGAGIAILALMPLTWRLCLTWRSSEALWNRVIAQDARRTTDARATLGLTLVEEGRLAEAIPVLEQASRDQEQTLRSRPGNFADQSRLGAALNNLGIALRQSGRNREARAAFRHAIDHQTIALNRAPMSFKCRHFLSNHYFNLAITQEKLGEPAEALASYERARSLREALVTSHPDSSPYREALASTEFEIGKLHRSKGRMAEALLAFRRAHAHRVELVRGHPNIGSLRSKLAKLDEEIGKIESESARE